MDERAVEKEIEDLRRKCEHLDTLVTVLVGANTHISKRLDMLESLDMTLGTLARGTEERLSFHLDSMRKIVADETPPPSKKDTQAGIEIA